MSVLQHSLHQRGKKHDWHLAIHDVHEARLMCKEKSRPKTCERGSSIEEMHVINFP